MGGGGGGGGGQNGDVIGQKVLEGWEETMGSDDSGMDQHNSQRDGPTQQSAGRTNTTVSGTDQHNSQRDGPTQQSAGRTNTTVSGMD